MLLQSCLRFHRLVVLTGQNSPPSLQNLIQLFLGSSRGSHAGSKQASRVCLHQVLCSHLLPLRPSPDPTLKDQACHGSQHQEPAPGTKTRSPCPDVCLPEPLTERSVLFMPFPHQAPPVTVPCRGDGHKGCLQRVPVSSFFISHPKSKHRWTYEQKPLQHFLHFKSLRHKVREPV